MQAGCEAIHVNAPVFRACNNPRGRQTPLHLSFTDGLGGTFWSTECRESAKLLVYMPLHVQVKERQKCNALTLCFWNNLHLLELKQQCQQLQWHFQLKKLSGRVAWLLCTSSAAGHHIWVTKGETTCWKPVTLSTRPKGGAIVAVYTGHQTLQAYDEAMGLDIRPC
eukprot:169590-Pelagomonas_calceolata.AAC.3